MNLVQGKNVVLSMFVIDGYYPLLCAKGFDYVVETEEIETTSVNSPNAREYIPGLSNSTVSITGVTSTSSISGELGPFYDLQESVRRATQLFKLTFTGNGGGFQIITFSGIFRKNSFSGAIPGLVQAAIDIRVSGAFSIATIAPPAAPGFTELADYWQTVNGNSFINGTSVEHAYTLTTTDTLLAVFVNGTPYIVVSGTPTVGTDQCKFTASTHRIDFPTDLVFDGTQTVDVVWRRTT